MKGENFAVCWSDEDQEYVATCEAFPSLSYLAPGPIQALAGLTRLIRQYRKELAEEEQ